MVRESDSRGTGHDPPARKMVVEYVCPTLLLHIHTCLYTQYYIDMIHIIVPKSCCLTLLCKCLYHGTPLLLDNTQIPCYTPSLDWKTCKYYYCYYSCNLHSCRKTPESPFTQLVPVLHENISARFRVGVKFSMHRPRAQWSRQFMVMGYGLGV